MESKETPVLTPIGPGIHIEQNKEYFDLALSIAAIPLNAYGYILDSNLCATLRYERTGRCSCYEKRPTNWGAASWWKYKDARLAMCSQHTKLYSDQCKERKKEAVSKKLDTIIHGLKVLVRDRDVATICQDMATIASAK